MILDAILLTLHEILIGLVGAIFIALVIGLIAHEERKLPKVEHHTGKERVGLDENWRWPAKRSGR